MILVKGICTLLDCLHEAAPVANLVAPVKHNLDTLLSKDLDMHGAVVSGTHWSVEAPVCLASVSNVRFGHILPEVEALSREALFANTFQKVNITDHAVAVQVKLLEDWPELIVRHLETPVRELVPQLHRRDACALRVAQVTVCFFDCLPLLADLGPDKLLQLLRFELILD